MLALVLAGPLARLRRFGTPDAIGAAILVLALVAAGCAVAWLSIRSLVAWSSRGGDVRDLIGRLEAARLHLLPALALAWNVDLVDMATRESAAIERALADAAPGFAVSMVSTLVLLYFMLACHRPMISRALASVRQARRRVVVLAALRDARHDTGRFVGTLALIYLGVGLLTGISLTLLGLPGAPLWGTLAAALSFVSYLGPIAMVAVLLLAGAGHFGATWLSFAPAAVFLVLHAVDSNIVSPALIGRRVAVSPVAVLVAMLFFGWLWGLAGAVIAVPLLVAVRSMLRRQRALRWLHNCITPLPRG